jgi:hypothetical protein
VRRELLSRYAHFFPGYRQLITLPFSEGYFGRYDFARSALVCTCPVSGASPRFGFDFCRF